MKFNKYLALLTLPMMISTAFADETPTKFSFSGFGTAAITKANTENGDFIRPNQSNGSSGSFDFGVDSMLGLQGTYKFNEQFSATAQALVRKNASDSFKGEIAWAFLKYKISNDLSMRAGRIGLPVFMISDYRNVGYANTMLRPPVEVYTQVPIESVDGIDVIYQHAFGDTNFTGQLAYGSTKPDLNIVESAKFKNVVALNMTLENGPFTLRAGRVDTQFDINYPSAQFLYNTLKTYGFNDTAESISFRNKKGAFTSVGATMDWNNILIQTEFAKRKTKTLAIPDTTSWYVMTGYRYGNFLPYFTHSSSKQDSAKTVSGIPSVATLAPLIAGANSIARSGQEQTSNSIGIRWDFHKSAALKVQVDRFSPKDGGTFANIKTEFNKPVTVVATAVDFVF